MTDERVLTGKLLVAAPTLTDPNFFRTVILVLAHSDDGALGVVLNRPTEVPIVAALPAWDDWTSEPRLVFGGGPVSPEAAIGLARTGSVDGGAEGFAPFAPPLGTIDLGRDPTELGPHLGGLRVYVGYAGWGGGQLDGEIAAGAWYVVDSLPGDGFDPAPGNLWRAVLRRQPGDLRFVATYPPDPALN